LSDNFLKITVMQGNQRFETPKEVIHKIVEMLEATGNVARVNTDTARASMTPDQFARYEKLSLSVCYVLLEASDFDNELT